MADPHPPSQQPGTIVVIVVISRAGEMTTMTTIVPV